jgi:hypothetical protein
MPEEQSEAAAGPLRLDLWKRCHVPPSAAASGSVLRNPDRLLCQQPEQLGEELIVIEGQV